MSTLLRSSFTIDRESVAPALEALQAWNYELPQHHSEYEAIVTARTLNDALHVIGFDLVEDLHGNVTDIQQHDSDVDSDFHEAAMASMRLWVNDDSFMLFISDDQEFYKWCWHRRTDFQAYGGGNVVFQYQIEELTQKLDELLRSHT